jgi:type IV pilus assembly protein PilA
MGNQLTRRSRNQEDNAMNQHKGFTLIELMAVISIVSILAAIALAAYADYIARSKVSEGLAFASEAKTSVSEYFYTQREWPVDNGAAGLPTVAEYELSSHNFLHYIEITSTPKQGSITIKFNIPGSKADNKLLQLIPSTADGLISWTCSPSAVDGISVNMVPPNCRGG